MTKTVIAAIIGIVFLVIIFQSFYTVDETEQVIILQWGEYKETIDNPGLRVKLPFVQSAKSLDKRILMSDAPPTSYLTLDKKNLEVDHITRWRIVEPSTFYKSIGSDEDKALQRLNAIVVSELRDELASFNLVDIISTQREHIMEDVSQRTAIKATEFGIEVIDLSIKRADLPEEVQENVFARMRAEREREAKKYRAEGEEQALRIRAEADREATIILAEAYRQEQALQGEGDALATAIYAAAYEQAPAFYSMLRALEAYTSIIDQETTMVLGTESDLFRYLDGSEPVTGK